MISHTSSSNHMPSKCKRMRKALFPPYNWPPSSVLSMSLQAVFELGVFNAIIGADRKASLSVKDIAAIKSGPRLSIGGAH
ncbi:hypothetical protein K1719_042072 [Acacia pycnantha]|nr:hypothetical protein K1719_042072 [Acacia pycnantha]